MYYLMKDDKKVMEYWLMECTIYEKELLPKELNNICIYNTQVGNMFCTKTNSFDELFKYVLSFVEDKNQDISKMNSIIDELSEKRIVNEDGYYFKRDAYLFHLSLEE